MAHFAKLNDENIVTQVVVIANAALDPNNEEASGIDFLIHWSGGDTNWVQTSYNGKIRKNYAGVGYTFNEALDGFIAPKCHDVAVLDEATCTWTCTDPAHEVIK
jgi:hypothetical protein